MLLYLHPPKFSTKVVIVTYSPDQGHREFPFWNDKIPPANGKIPVSQIDSFCGYTRRKKLPDKPGIGQSDVFLART